MPRFSNIPPRRKAVKINIDYVKLYADQRTVLADIIEDEGTIGKALLQIKSGFANGTFDRRLSELLQLQTSIIYNRKTKLCIDTKHKIDKPLIESEVEKAV